METEIKDILIQKLKEKNVRKFNGYTLGLHANHIANAILRKKGIKKGSAEYASEHPKIKELVKKIHKELPAQEVSKKAEAPAPAQITPAQLARETSSVEVEAPASELSKVKAELKALKALIASSKTIKSDLAEKIQDAYKRYKQLKEAKSELSKLKEQKVEKQLGQIKERLKVATAKKTIGKALKEGVKKLKEKKAKAEKPRKLTPEEMKERFKQHKEAKAREKAEAEAPAPAPAPAPVEKIKWEDFVYKNYFNGIADEMIEKMKLIYVDDSKINPIKSVQDEINDKIKELKKSSNIKGIYVKNKEDSDIITHVLYQYTGSSVDDMYFEYRYVGQKKNNKYFSGYKLLPISKTEYNMIDYGEYDNIK